MTSWSTLFRKIAAVIVRIIQGVAVKFLECCLKHSVQARAHKKFLSLLGKLLEQQYTV
jgi:hypothetical protein